MCAATRFVRAVLCKNQATGRGVRPLRYRHLKQTVPGLAKLIAFGRATRAQRFEQLMEPHFEALYSAARRMTHSPDDAEDLVQEVCMKAFTALDELETIEYPRAWLLKVMYHRFVDDTRRASRMPVDNSATGAESGEPDHLASGLAQPDDAADREQRVERVLRAMRLLNSDQVALVGMHDVEGISIDELSRLTGAPAGTIKAQLHRTRKKLGRLLANSAVSRPKLRVIGGKR